MSLTLLLARKIRCDQSLPKCNRCIQSGRDCKGYGLQLSWPRRNDKRRAMLGPNSNHARFKSTPTGHRLVNAFSRDIELHDWLLSSTSIYGVTALEGVDTSSKYFDNRVFEKQTTPLLLLKSPTEGVISQLSPSKRGLFQYCKTPLR